MPLILVDEPHGVQKLKEIHESGRYFDITRVLWDERVDGPFPAKFRQIGGLTRSGNKLQYSRFKKLWRWIKKLVRTA